MQDSYGEEDDEPPVPPQQDVAGNMVDEPSRAREEGEEEGELQEEEGELPVEARLCSRSPGRHSDFDDGSVSGGDIVESR